MVPSSDWEIEGKSGSARRYYRKNIDLQETIRNAITKICLNPFRDSRLHAIRSLKGPWDGYREYRIQDPLLRIIYRVTDRPNHMLYIEEIISHL